MTPDDIRVVLEPSMHGAATPAPLPTEPEPPPIALPVPEPEPPPIALPVPEPEPPPSEMPPPAPTRWDGLSFIAGESAAEFNEFYERLDDHYMPFNEEERICVAKLAEARWALRRRKRVVDRVEADLYAAVPDPIRWTAMDFNHLALADAYRKHAEDLVERAQRNVDAFVFDRSRFSAEAEAKRAAA